MLHKETVETSTLELLKSLQSEPLFIAGIVFYRIFIIKTTFLLSSLNILDQSDGATYIASIGKTIMRG